MSYIGSKPANKPVVASDLDPAVITGQTALTSSPADTDEFIISDGGVLKRLDASLVGGGGITVADMFRLTADKSDNSVISANLERCDDASFGRIGSAMTESSGVFTFPSTGIYQVIVSATIRSVSDNNTYVVIEATRNNGTAFDELFFINGGNGNGTINTVTVCGSAFIDVTDVGQHKARFRTTSLATTNCIIQGNTDYSATTFTFIRLGDT